MNILALAGISLLLLLLLLYILGRKMGYKIAAIVVIVIFGVELVYVLVHNMLGVYQTPEEAFSAAHDRLQAQDIVYGQDTALALGQKDGMLVWSILDRTENGWRIGDAQQDRERLLFRTDTGSGSLYHREGTPDYYLVLSFRDGAEHRVEDSCGSVFRPGSPSGTESRSFAVLEDWPADYTLLLDGEPAELLAEPSP